MTLGKWQLRVDSKSNRSHRDYRTRKHEVVDRLQPLAHEKWLKQARQHYITFQGWESWNIFSSQDRSLTVLVLKKVSWSLSWWSLSRRLSLGLTILVLCLETRVRLIRRSEIGKIGTHQKIGESDVCTVRFRFACGRHAACVLSD